MRLAIMQPYFFPYIGYWQLINAVDCFIILDDVNYIKRGWISRNRILCDGKEHYIINPVRHRSQNRQICKTDFINDSFYISNIKKTIEYAYRKAPYKNELIELTNNSMPLSINSVSEYLTYHIKVIIDYLNIDTRIEVSSKLRNKNTKKGQDGILELCKLCGCDEYVNAIGGKDLYDRDEFKKNKINLRYLKTDFDFIQRKLSISHMDYSILHLIANCSKNDIIWMLDKYRFE